jgi:hypothetical protein
LLLAAVKERDVVLLKQVQSLLRWVSSERSFPNGLHSADRCLFWRGQMFVKTVSPQS